MDKPTNAGVLPTAKNPMNQITDAQSYVSKTLTQESTKIASFEEALENVRAKRNAEDSVESLSALESGPCVADRYNPFTKFEEIASGDRRHGDDSSQEPRVVIDNMTVLSVSSARTNDVIQSIHADSTAVVDAGVVLSEVGMQAGAEVAEAGVANSLSDYVNNVMQRISEATENAAGKWTFEVVERFNGMSGLRLERSEQGVWRIQIGLDNSVAVKHEQAEHQMSTVLSSLLSALKSHGHKIESVSFNGSRTR